MPAVIPIVTTDTDTALASLKEEFQTDAPKSGFGSPSQREERKDRRWELKAVQTDDWKVHPVLHVPLTTASAGLAVRAEGSIRDGAARLLSAGPVGRIRSREWSRDASVEQSRV